MRRLTIIAALGMALFLAQAFPGFVNAAPGDKSTIATLEISGPVTSPSVIDYRWADLALNSYAQTYIDLYSYGDAMVTVEYETGLATFTGTLHAENLKPNFAYQLKIVGKPEGLFDPVTEGGDDAANERIGYAGRWWEVAPGTGNRSDAQYEANKDTPGYIFEAYLLFDFFLTDSNGNADLAFALDSSYHVLWWDHQRTQGSCDSPLKTTTVLGSAAHDAYDSDVGPTSVGVFPEIERHCNGGTALPMGTYNCRILLTEESFHSSNGNWAPAVVNNDIQFNIGAGLFPPNMVSEPTYTAGTGNIVSWNAVTGATFYYPERSTSPDFSTDLVNSGWTEDLFFASTGLADGQIYYYRVKARDVTLAESSWSATVSSTQDAMDPESEVGTLPSSHTGSHLSIPFTASDVVSEIDFVELFFNVEGGAFSQYGGTFTSSPINFAVPGNGNFGFYTRATDNAGNVEVVSGLADDFCVLTMDEAPNPVTNSDFVDIGFLDSEAGHSLFGWGPIEPDTHGGGWGGIGGESPPGKCRTIWSPDEDVPVEKWADLLLDFGPEGGPKTLWLRHLDGGSDDSFDLSIDGTVVLSVSAPSTSEHWEWVNVDVPGYNGVQPVRIEAVAIEPDDLWYTYGQVAFDIISICGAPALFEALPVDSAPIACGQSKQVDFNFTQGCEYIRGYSLRVSSNTGLSFDDGDVTIHDSSGTGDFTASIVQTAVNDWTIDYSINGDSALPSGIPSDSNLFSINFLGEATGTGQVVIESVTVTPIFQGPPNLALDSVGTTIPVDCGSPAAPAAVTNLTAEPGKGKILVSWQDPPDIDIISLEIYRSFWYDADMGGVSAYPEYGGLPNDLIPSRPDNQADALASSEWELAATVLPGEESFLDANGVDGLERGIYFYEVFAADSEGLYGPPADANDMATSYLLGDFDGDGAITVVPDVNNWLALCYGTADDGNDPPLNGYLNECDVGPTDDNSGVGIPLPDDYIGFDDLMILAVNFDTQFTKSPAEVVENVMFVWTELETGTWSLALTAPCVDLKGLNLKSDLPAGAVLSLSGGELLAGQDGPVFLQNIDRFGLDTGLAMLGDGIRIRGAGELLRLTMASGHAPTKAVIEPRNSGNMVIPCEVEISGEIPEIPATLQVFPNYPNPFNPKTSIEFQLSSREHVQLAVFGLDGRRIDTLVDGVLPAGHHEVIWDGRDKRGNVVAAGTYFYRFKAGTYSKTCKMTLLK